MTIGLLVLAGAAQAASTFISTCPTVISSPGDYLLSADLTCGGGNAITIASSDVTLKLERHKITAGVGAGSAISNLGSPFGTSVARVHILGPGLITSGGGNAFLDGVALTGFVTDSEVSGITVRGSSSAGVFVDGAFGNASLTVTNNTLGQNGTGISVINLDSSTISENDVSGNGVGISIDNADVCFCHPNLMLNHNIVSGNTGDGVNITAGLLLIPTVTFQNNVTSGNSGNGISALTGEITNNRSLANGKNDLFDSGVTGCEAVWSGNTFFTANQSCIH